MQPALAPQEGSSKFLALAPLGLGMNSRVHPTYKTKDRVTNWAEYDQSLVQRGDITLCITPAAIKAWTPKSSGHRGAPQRYRTSRSRPRAALHD
ncbi:MAG: hypothetical protein ACI835_005551 [Planctomycetota bacterium]|jgi:hypothetical protein